MHCLNVVFRVLEGDDIQESDLREALIRGALDELESNSVVYGADCARKHVSRSDLESYEVSFEGDLETAYEHFRSLPCVEKVKRD